MAALSVSVTSASASSSEPSSASVGAAAAPAVAVPVDGAAAVEAALDFSPCGAAAVVPAAAAGDLYKFNHVCRDFILASSAFDMRSA